ncbi:MAG: DNA repair protein RecO, partial [Planctomycetota bacterium]
MASEPTTAIVLRAIEFSETSLIVTLLTRDFGQVAAIAKGARRPKSSFEGALDLLAVCRVLLIRKSSDALDLLTEAKLIRRFRGGEKSLDRVYAGYYIAEMLRLLTDNHDPHPGLYDLALQALGLVDGDGNLPLALLGFDVAALRLLGHAPSTRTCVDCGTGVTRETRVSFSPVGGGVVCRQCRSRQVSILTMSSSSVEQLERILAPHCRLPINVDPHNYKELRSALNRYFQALLG